MPMNVILLERVPKLGQMGDVVKVKPGFARNYLLPQKKALRATKDNITYFESQRKTLEAQNLERRKDAEAVAAKMADLKVSEGLAGYGAGAGHRLDAHGRGRHRRRARQGYAARPLAASLRPGSHLPALRPRQARPIGPRSSPTRIHALRLAYPPPCARPDIPNVKRKT